VAVAQKPGAVGAYASILFPRHKHSSLVKHNPQPYPHFAHPSALDDVPYDPFVHHLPYHLIAFQASACFYPEIVAVMNSLSSTLVALLTLCSTLLTSLNVLKNLQLY
jgi:hypothetical protein